MASTRRWAAAGLGHWWSGPFEFIHIWTLLMFAPFRAFRALRSKPAPHWGLCGVLVRFIPTALIVPLPLYLKSQAPFQPPYLSLIPASDYYLAEIFLLPVFGVGIWLLMSALAHTAVRLAGAPSNFDTVLNVVGMGLVTPMLVVWAWDSLMIAFGTYTLVVMAVSHSLAQTWEAVVEAIGLRDLAGFSGRAAALTAVLINLVFIGVASMLVR